MTISLYSHCHCKCNNNEEECIILKFPKEMTNVRGQEVFPIQQNLRNNIKQKTQHWPKLKEFKAILRPTFSCHKTKYR